VAGVVIGALTTGVVVAGARPPAALAVGVRTAEASVDAPLPAAAALRPAVLTVGELSEPEEGVSLAQLAAALIASTKSDQPNGCSLIGSASLSDGVEQ
jgi:hypothetical protein